MTTFRSNYPSRKALIYLVVSISDSSITHYIAALHTDFVFVWFDHGLKGESLFADFNFVLAVFRRRQVVRSAEELQNLRRPFAIPPGVITHAAVNVRDSAVRPVSTVKSILDVNSGLAHQIVGRRHVVVPHLNHQHVISRETRLDLEHAAGQ